MPRNDRLSSRLIRDFEAFQKSLRFFESWFPDLGKVTPTDLDFVLHAGNPGSGTEVCTTCERPFVTDKFLVMEFKNGGTSTGFGQRMLFDALRQLGMTVVTVHENRDGTFYLSGDWHGTVSRDELAGRVAGWWDASKERRKSA